MGRLIPAGTGFEWYRHVRIPADEPPPRTCAFITDQVDFAAVRQGRRCRAMWMRRLSAGD